MKKLDEVGLEKISRKTLFGSAEFLNSLPKETKSQFAATIDLKTFSERSPEISRTNAQLLVDQALILLEMFYVHMPLKRAMHAIDPIQQLRLIKYRLDQMPENKPIDAIRFHNQMLRVFTSLRDCHTNYILPNPFRDKTAFLPFLIEEFFEDGRRKYIISKYIEPEGGPNFSHPTFKPGVEILHWNGVPIERAVELNADREAGSNLEARHAQGSIE